MWWWVWYRVICVCMPCTARWPAALGLDFVALEWGFHYNLLVVSNGKLTEYGSQIIDVGGCEWLLHWQVDRQKPILVVVVASSLTSRWSKWVVVDGCGRRSHHERINRRTSTIRGCRWGKRKKMSGGENMRLGTKEGIFGVVKKIYIKK